jgi:sirohydrochlorin ferrochelatase
MTNQVIIVSHGQPSAPGPAEEALAALAAQIQAFLPDWAVASATLAAPGRLDSVISAAEGKPVVYPLFMSAGWFVTRMLPQRLGHFDCDIAEPFGLDLSLPDLAASGLKAEIALRGWDPQQTDVLLAAHGSAKGNKAAEAANNFAHVLSAGLSLGKLRTGFVEQEPFISDVARGMGPKTLCLPFFAQAGDHVRQDIPEGLRSSLHKIEQLPCLGAFDGVPGLIADAVAARKDRK